ncbi:MAG: response regulator transcription factor [Pseudomonadota bacterium]
MKHLANMLVVADDHVLCQMLAERSGLAEEFRISFATCGSAALKLSKMQKFDIVLADETLPDMRGSDFYRRCRMRRMSMPILVLSTEESTWGGGACIGKENVVRKPVCCDELVTRIRRKMRVQHLANAAEQIIGSLRFDPGKQRLTAICGGQLQLTPKETGLLFYLHQARGRAVPRAILLREIWGKRSDITTHTVETHVYRLRQKLKAFGAEGILLSTVADGYCLEFKMRAAAA